MQLVLLRERLRKVVHYCYVILFARYLEPLQNLSSDVMGFIFWMSVENKFDDVRSNFRNFALYDHVTGTQNSHALSNCICIRQNFRRGVFGSFISFLKFSMLT